MTAPAPDDHVCPTNERCPECHSIPLHLLHRWIIERDDLRLTEDARGDPMLAKNRRAA